MSELKVVSIISLLLGVWLSFGGSLIDSAATTAAVAEAVAAPASNSSPIYKTIAIREIQPAGYKVLADNPQSPGQATGEFGEFDPKTWQVHRFLMDKPNGGWLRIGLARPMAWIESVERNDSGQVWLEFEELGIADWATLQATEPCPTDILGEGRLVTGTFEHSSGEVLNLFIAGEATPIGSTANHPFWSEDRQDFVQAGSLEPGEHLRLADGRTPVVTAAVPRSQSVPVFNLEVDGEHVYYVAARGVLVHNSCVTEQEAIESGLAHDANDRSEVRDPRHHGFPNEFENADGFFSQRGIDIDEYTVELSESDHQAIHGGGDWRLGREWEGEWNRHIKSTIDEFELQENRQATPLELEGILIRELNRYGIEPNFVPYKD